MAGSIAVAVPALAEDYVYPPIVDPVRAIEQRVEETTEPARDPVGAVEQTIAPDVTGECHFQGGTIEGAAAATGTPEQIGIVCRVYDERGIQRGGCGLFVPGVTAECAAPTQLVLGPPRVCYEAYAVYSWGTDKEVGCKW
ncbi:MAG TPA: hypothetical protein VEU29_03590 [Actinomycetota bacterium]|nr:hypothetical protein [Actinomycetota bacterium]